MDLCLPSVRAIAKAAAYPMGEKQPLRENSTGVRQSFDCRPPILWPADAKSVKKLAGLALLQINAYL